jgi:hypothetical protein
MTLYEFVTLLYTSESDLRDAIANAGGSFLGEQTVSGTPGGSAGSGAGTRAGTGERTQPP